MKANYQKLNFDLRSESFNDFWVKSDVFGFHWHYHPEIEICYVKQGFGQRLIGETVERFEVGDFVLVGSNLPHCWISDELFNQSEEQMQVFVVHIDYEKLKPLLSLHEFSLIDKLLRKAVAGFSFDIKKSPKIFEVLREFEQIDGLTKTLKLLELLHLMALSPTKRQLCTSTYKPETGKQTEERILNVCQFIHENYREKIRLDELANIVHMNNAAFCRFFKKVIGKTPMEYINELRINAATSEIRISTKTINQIAYENGFGSLSHFNKLFQKYHGKTPSVYRKVFR